MKLLKEKSFEFFKEAITMDNVFSNFVKIYEADIKAFIEAFKAFIEVLVAKFTADEDAE